jgi:hypothetical protein
MDLVSDDRHHDVGLTRRELEREVQWLLRHVPAEPAQIAKLMTQVMVTLIDKNNAALARRMEPRDDGAAGAP